MMAKLKIVFPFFILIGAVLLLAEVDQTFNLYNVPYVLIIVGSIGVVLSLISANTESSFFCRVGLHKYQRISQDSELPALYVYRCERCGKRKKAFSVI